MNNLNQLPCPILITDAFGLVLATNSELLTLIGKTAAEIEQKPIDNLFPPVSRIFLQTHVWTTLFHEGSVKEIYLKIYDAKNKQIPILLNCKKGNFEGEESFFWVFFVTMERSKFEVKLLEARRHAEEATLALAEREKFVKTITDAMPSLVGYWDKNLCCRFANKSYFEWFGKSPEFLIGTALADLLGESLFAFKESYIVAVLTGKSQTFESTIIKQDGSIGYTLVNYIQDLDIHGEVVGFFALISDVTTMKTAEFELKLAASVFDNTIEGIIFIDASGVLLSVNAAFTKITGYTLEEVIEQPLIMLSSNPLDEEFYASIYRHIAEEGCWQGETWNRRKDGEIFLAWQSITVIRGAGNEPTRYVSIFNDITKFWQKDERMRHLAFHDSLTDLPNRILLTERLGQLIGMTERNKRGIAVMFIDLDGFKAVNDTLGHDIGDDVLKAVAHRLASEVRPSDTVARIGGDEFVILIDNPANHAELVCIAARIVLTVNKPMSFRGKSAAVGTSIGIAVHNIDGISVAELMKSADTAMYAAKKAGKNTHRFFSEL
jgi:two-component system CheB/CheR fusion protein